MTRSMTIPSLLLATLVTLHLPVRAADGDAGVQPDPFAVFGEEPLPLTVEHSVNHSGYFEWGLGLTSADNTGFGRDSGLDNNGVSAIFTMQMREWRPPQPDAAAGYWGLDAHHLGLDSRDLSLYWGAVDDYFVSLWYDEQTRHNDKDGKTPYLGAGSSYLWLPSDWVAASTTAGMTALPKDLQRFEQKIRRETLGLAFRKRLDQRWTFLSSAAREEKNGLATTGAAFYLDASNPHAVILPQPIDTITDDIHVAARYGDGDRNLELGYLYSRFDNHDSLLTWQNPYDTNYGAGIDYPAGIGGISEAPDNQMQQIRLSGNFFA